MHADLHDVQSARIATALGVIALIIVAFLVRKKLVGFQNADYHIFASWYDYVKAHGIASFKTDFSNYNPPYTYFLYLATLLPVSKIVAIKGLLVAFDALLAIAVYMVVKQLRPGHYAALMAALLSLFLPTVLLTGVFWGQFDQFYTAFILFSLWALLKSNSKLAWLFFGIAIAIKLQAIFFLPVLIIFSFKRIKWWDATYGAGAFVVLTGLPLLAGRSLGSILNIYVAQTGLFNGTLTLNAPNIYQWVPNSLFDAANSVGLYLTAAAVIAVFMFSLLYKKEDNKQVALVSAIMLFMVPFLLPQMHERYFFPATIAAFVLVFAYARLWWVALLLQATTFFSYVPFLFNTAPPVPFTFLALAGLALLATLLAAYVRPQLVK